MATEFTVLVNYASVFKKGNTSYPDKVTVKGIEGLKSFVYADNMPAIFDGHTRKIPSKKKDGTYEKAVRGKHAVPEFFLQADCIIVDIDNDFSENPDDWITPEKLSEILGGEVEFYAVPSKSNMIAKTDSKGVAHTPRPKYHYYFPIHKRTDFNEYQEILYKVYEYISVSDPACTDVKHFFASVTFGGADDNINKVQYFSGSMLIDDYLSNSPEVPAEYADFMARVRQRTQYTRKLKTIQGFRARTQQGTLIDTPLEAQQGEQNTDTTDTNCTPAKHDTPSTADTPATPSTPSTQIADIDLATAREIASEGGKANYTIAAGDRHAYIMSSAMTLIKKYGDCAKAKAELWQDIKLHCQDWQDKTDAEVESIYEYAIGYYKQDILTDPTYKDPKEYARLKAEEDKEKLRKMRARISDPEQTQQDIEHNPYQVFNALLPPEFKIAEQADIFAECNRDRARYCKATQWLTYRQTGKGGGYWQINDELGTLNLYDELALRQEGLWQDICDSQYLRNFRYKDTYNKLVAQGKEDDFDKLVARFYNKLHDLRDKSDLVIKASRQRLEIDALDLDKDPYVLNTPSGIISLKDGEYLSPDEASKHHCTKITNNSPSVNGMDIWLKFVDDVCCQRQDLADYLQLVMGEMLIGRVHEEHLIIAYNQHGKNGKSTFFNTLAKVLGTYSILLPSKLLVRSGRYINADAYVADLQGVRMALMKELNGGERLSEDTLKELFSQDDIQARRLYCDPVKFEPSHSGVLFTNNLPTIINDDGGTTRRLLIIPFDAIFEGEKRIKNFAEYLYDQAGDAVLQWAIDGAKKLIAADYNIQDPDCVKEATGEYLAENDTVQQFIDDCLEVGENLSIGSKTLYTLYEDWASLRKKKGQALRPFTRGEFKSRMIDKGYTYTRNKHGLECKGVAMNPDFGVSLYSNSAIDDKNYINQLLERDQEQERPF